MGQSLNHMLHMLCTGMQSCMLCFNVLLSCMRIYAMNTKNAD